MRVPEFQDEMRFLLETKNHISNEDILSAMERIYDSYDAQRRAAGKPVPGVYYGGMRRGRNRLREVLESDQNCH